MLCAQNKNKTTCLQSTLREKQQRTNEATHSHNSRVSGVISQLRESHIIGSNNKSHSWLCTHPTFWGYALGLSCPWTTSQVHVWVVKLRLKHAHKSFVNTRGASETLLKLSPGLYSADKLLQSSCLHTFMVQSQFLLQQVLDPFGCKQGILASPPLAPTLLFWPWAAWKNPFKQVYTAVSDVRKALRHRIYSNMSQMLSGVSPDQTWWHLK